MIFHRIWISATQCRIHNPLAGLPKGKVERADVGIKSVRHSLSRLSVMLTTHWSVCDKQTEGRRKTNYIFVRKIPLPAPALQNLSQTIKMRA